MKLNPRRRRRAGPAGGPALLTWWMPAVGVVAALCWSFWVAVADASDDWADRFSAFVEAALWPGMLIFVATTAIVWLAWKVDLD